MPAAHMLKGVTRFHPVTPILSESYWFLVVSQAQFKVLVGITYKVLCNLGPGYVNVCLTSAREAFSMPPL